MHRMCLVNYFVCVLGMFRCVVSPLLRRMIPQLLLGLQIPVFPVVTALVGWDDRYGAFASMIMLLLQLGSSAGTYPIELAHLGCEHAGGTHMKTVPRLSYKS